MPRSSGARPKKEQREEVAYLRERLGECTGDQWQKAGAIFQEICRLCDHKGSKGGHGSPYPRACRHCNRYGHSTQFCEVRKAEARAREEVEVDKLLAEHRAHKAQSKGTTLPPYWQARFKWLQERHDAAYDTGLKGCVEEGSLGGPCIKCAGCKQWHAFMRKRDTLVPWTGGDAPKP
jgi:hypothetical protein